MKIVLKYLRQKKIKIWGDTKICSISSLQTVPTCTIYCIMINETCLVTKSFVHGSKSDSWKNYFLWGYVESISFGAVNQVNIH